MTFIVSVVLFGKNYQTTSSLLLAPRVALGQETEGSLRLNNYNNWVQPGNTDETNEIFKFDRVVMTEQYSGESGLTPASIKAKNPNAKVYRVYDLLCKNVWDYDWPKADGGTGNPDKPYMQTPLLKTTIDTNNWWLRDNQGNQMTEGNGGRIYYMDPGKIGVLGANTILKSMLDRNKDLGFDGFVFDYNGLNFYDADNPDNPAKKAYPNESDWNTALENFIKPIYQGLKNNNYEIITNGAAMFGTPREINQYYRNLSDGGIQENYAEGNAGWTVTASAVLTYINAIKTDTKEYWVSDYFLKAENLDDPTYLANQRINLATYYLGLPMDENLRLKRFYYNYGYSTEPMKGRLHYDNLFSLDLGVPNTDMTTQDGKNFWSRRYSKGLVLLNWENDTLSYTLDQNYIDEDGKIYSGTINIAGHAGLVLKTASSAALLNQLTATLTADKTQAKSGETVTYSLIVKNNATEKALNVKITNPFDQTRVGFIEANTGGTVKDGVISWPAFDLDAKASKTLTFKISVK